MLDRDAALNDLRAVRIDLIDKEASLTQLEARAGGSGREVRRSICSDACWRGSALPVTQPVLLGQT